MSLPSPPPPHPTPSLPSNNHFYPPSPNSTSSATSLPLEHISPPTPTIRPNNISPKRTGSILENAHEAPRLSRPNGIPIGTRSGNGNGRPVYPSPVRGRQIDRERAFSGSATTLGTDHTFATGSETVVPSEPEVEDGHALPHITLDTSFQAQPLSPSLGPASALPHRTTRKSSISFAPLPSPERPRQRRNSITLGVAARSQILRSQGSGAAPRPRPRGPKVVHVYEGGQDWSAAKREQVVDLGELGKKLWKKWREGRKPVQGGKEMSTEEAREREREEEAVLELKRQESRERAARVLGVPGVPGVPGVQEEEEEREAEELEKEAQEAEGPTAHAKPTPGSPPPELEEGEAEAEGEEEGGGEGEGGAEEEEEEEEPAVEEQAESEPEPSHPAPTNINTDADNDKENDAVAGAGGWQGIGRRRSRSPSSGGMTYVQREVLGFVFSDADGEKE
ncbi:hypothetical protein DACRYDRAFT_108809 [Dacryopinax primogenitus]|uniref:Uncharacterized protein n=1 Tax=Dacryopinax primogenitus (strain DJM 731) TaxID=1858805 RepID=M5FT49_DACPD|nr:uncharacterized protein DACRYDRAFT_108809 [Dacryopinax primogenitus]EJU00746.1 hypothetical protein DACRYDRAFT_108809 [Dacryopinax primogenitus]